MFSQDLALEHFALKTTKFKKEYIVYIKARTACYTLEFLRNFGHLILKRDGWERKGGSKFC